MRKVLRKGPRRYTIVSQGDTRSGESYKVFPGRGAALTFVKTLRTNSFNLWAFRDIVGSSSLTDAKVLEKMADLLWRGQYKIVSDAKASPALGKHQKSKEPEPEQSDQPDKDEVPIVPPEPLVSIKFKIVDDKTNEVITGVPLKVRHTDKQTVRDENPKEGGVIEIKNIKKGTCDVVEMLDKGAFEVVKVVTEA